MVVNIRCPIAVFTQFDRSECAVCCRRRPNAAIGVRVAGLQMHCVLREVDAPSLRIHELSNAWRRSTLFESGLNAAFASREQRVGQCACVDDVGSSRHNDHQITSRFLFRLHCGRFKLTSPVSYVLRKWLTICSVYGS